MAEHFDIVVIGAGPAGSMAATSAAKTGRKVCLMERKPDAGRPVRCGEGIGYRSLVENIEARPEWIKSAIKHSEMVSPSGIRVKIESVEESYILDRERMDSDLVKDAVCAGATYYPQSPVNSLHRSGKVYQCIGPVRNVSASCVILADGVESKLARFAGWNTSLRLSDVETCAFCRIVSPLIPKETCIFYTGSNVAPGGYAWVFPRGVGEANVGLGIIGSRSDAGMAKQLLLKFIDKEFPSARIGYLHCGGVPVARWTRPLVKDGVMLVGDAARQVNCISGAGIGYSLFAGKLSGRIAGEAFKGSDIDYQYLKKYEVLWKKRFGKQQDRSFSLKEFVTKHADDKFLDRIASSLAKEDPADMNYLRVFIKAFSRNPLLLFKAIKLFG